MEVKEKRLFSRIACELELVVRDSRGDRQVPVNCRDLSLSGLGLAETPPGIQVGQVLDVALEGFPPVRAVVRWLGDRGVGLRFRGHILDVVDTWVGEVLSAHGMLVRDLLVGD